MYLHIHCTCYSVIVYTKYRENMNISVCSKLYSNTSMVLTVV